MNVCEIVEAHLKSIGADGLCCDGCGCGINSLFDCGMDGGDGVPDCVPARRVLCKDCTERCEHYDACGGCYKPMEIET